MSRTGAGGFGLGDHPRGDPLQGMPDDPSEYGWGSDLVPPGLDDAPPSKGGMYRGTTPECPPQVGVSRR